MSTFGGNRNGNEEKVERASPQGDGPPRDEAVSRASHGPSLRGASSPGGSSCSRPARA